MGHPSASERVAAVVVTFNRREVLREALNALLSQTVPLTVLVVDNGSGDSTGRMIEAEFPDVVYLGQADNLGPAGGFAVGVEEALRRGAAWVWLFNDDDRPSPDALAHLLERVGPGTEKPADLIGCWLRGEGGEILTRGVLWRSREVDIAAPAQGAAPYPA
ncbi:MAG: glycosyltransferase, partial [Candidatus Methylomirabilales bacterium]